MTSGHSDAKGERQSARMSKFANDGFTRSGKGCLIAVPYGNSGHQKGKF